MYQYKVITLGKLGYSPDLDTFIEERLNTQGSQGWDLLDFHRGRYVFRRKVVKGNRFFNWLRRKRSERKLKKLEKQLFQRIAEMEQSLKPKTSEDHIARILRDEFGIN